MIQKYSRCDRQALHRLSSLQEIALLHVLETEEKGRFVAFPALCARLRHATFFLFSCLSGSGKREELPANLGSFFETRLFGKGQKLLEKLRHAGYSNPLVVIVDDTEPTRVWKWKVSEKEVSDWYRMVAEEAKVPEGIAVRLWSDIEREAELSAGRLRQRDAVLFWQLFEHMRRFPNQKMREGIDFRGAVYDRAMHYEHQAAVLKRIPTCVLVQTETPWELKDMLYFPHEKGSELPIIHPFSEERG